MPRMTMGVVENMNTAKKIVHTLQDAGYLPGEISVLVKDNSAAGIPESEHAVSTGVVSGATAGGVLGAISGLLIGFGVVAIPGIGPLLAGGPLLNSLGLVGAAASTATAASAGVVAGGAAGGIIGALVKIGVSRERAQEYEARLKEGSILISVVTDRLGMETADQIFVAQGATLITNI